MSFSLQVKKHSMVKFSSKVPGIGKHDSQTIMDNQPPTAINYHITLLRHGQSQGNFEGRHQGQADFPLTDLGRQQTNALVDRWKAEKKEIDLIISSPLMRARETAEIIATVLGIPLVFDPLWMERDNGLMAG